MVGPKKRLWVRDPLTFEEEIGDGTYYSAEDFTAIFRSFTLRPDLDQAEFERRLESKAGFFVDWAAVDPEQPPSIRERFWRSLSEKVEDFLRRFDGLDYRQRPDLLAAAEALAKRERALPDFPAEVTPLAPVAGSEAAGPSHMTIWPVERQIEKCLEELRWLRDIASEAARIATREKDRPGNRPVEAKHFLFRSLTEIYESAAQTPEKPWKDRETGEHRGEALDFLESCLRPLGIPDNRGTIYETYRRSRYTV